MNVKVKLSDPLHACARDYCRRKRGAIDGNDGVAALCRELLRSYLSRAGYSTEQLDHNGPSDAAESCLSESEGAQRVIDHETGREA